MMASEGSYPAALLPQDFNFTSRSSRTLWNPYFGLLRTSQVVSEFKDSACGILKEKVAPSPGLLFTQIVPP